MVRKQIGGLIHSLADIVGGSDPEEQQLADEMLARINQMVDQEEERIELEETRREKMGLIDAEAPQQWCSSYYMRQGYRVIAVQDDSQGHWCGGPPIHDGAECPICRKPLLLFWDINCKDPRFLGESTKFFGDLERLPLYYCCRRPEPTIYRVVSSNRIETIRPDLASGEETPFEAFPEVFERRPISLRAIPREIMKTLIIAKEYDFNWLETGELAQLSEFLGDDVQDIDDIRFSQFGGSPSLLQGHSDIDCPNPSCPTRSMGHPMFRDDRHFQMKELAVIDVDAGFEMETSYAQIVFHICWKCLTIHAAYQCD